MTDDNIQEAVKKLVITTVSARLVDINNELGDLGKTVSEHQSGIDERLGYFADDSNARRDELRELSRTVEGIREELQELGQNDGETADALAKIRRELGDLAEKDGKRGAAVADIRKKVEGLTGKGAESGGTIAVIQRELQDVGDRQAESQSTAVSAADLEGVLATWKKLGQIAAAVLVIVTAAVVWLLVTVGGVPQ